MPVFVVLRSSLHFSDGFCRPTGVVTMFWKFTVREIGQASEHVFFNSIPSYCMLIEKESMHVFLAPPLIEKQNSYY